LPAGDRHAYFDRLAARPECVVAKSLRDQAQIESLRGNKKPEAIRRINYVFPTDDDPRRQDLAKIVIPEGEGRLGNDVRVPIPPHAGRSVLVTWDIWLGREWHFAHTRIDNSKGSPYIGDDRSGGGFFEWQMTWALARRATHSLPPGGDPEISPYDALPTGYVTMFSPNSLAGAIPHWPPYFRGGHTRDASGQTLRTVMPREAAPKDRRDYGEAPGPYSAEFGVRAERTCRSWWFFEPLDGRNWRASIWAADVDRGAVLVVDRWHFTADVDEPFRQWIFHMGVGNADATDVLLPGRGPLTAYVGNLVVLHGVSSDDVRSLLQSPEA
jgi:hypothetical protein